MRENYSIAEFERVMDVAGSNPNKYAACQDMGWAARFAPADKVIPAANKAIRLALTLPETYQQIAVQAWPIRALLERGHLGEGRKNMQQIVELHNHIPHGLNRCDALFLIWESVAPLLLQDKQRLLEVVQSSCLTCQSWRGTYYLRDLILQLAREAPEVAEEILTTMPEGKHKRQAVTRLKRQEYVVPRSFFW